MACSALLFSSPFSAQIALAQHVVSLPPELADPGTQVESVLEGLAYSEGPTVDPAGNLYFSEDPDVNDGRIWKITPDGTKSIYKDPSRGSNGLEMDNQGRLHIAMLDSVLRIEPDGKTTVLAAKSGTLNLGRVNDLSLSSTGTLFFSNLSGNTLFFRGMDGQIRTQNFYGVNGVEWIEEKSILYVASEGLQRCAVDNATGEVGACTYFAGWTDGLTVDANGNVYRASRSEGRIIVHDSTGNQLGYIAIAAKEVQGKRYSPGSVGNASNCHFGGADGKTLFITGDGGCYKVGLKVAGRLRPGQAGSGLSRFRIGSASAPGADLRKRAWSAEASGFLFAAPAGEKVLLNGRRALSIAPVARAALPGTAVPKAE
ncbi:MAG TPA: SMP-30/gluconolactonase/LRE family protein [Fibrobacteria bacterium]|nr:SMP-30/gluconolactonase/LRE family protein [Fibrobacteria bacterium]